MSKQYPPIFNVILFAVAVIFMLLNPIANLIPWLPEAIKTAATVAIYALYDFFNAAGKFIVDTYNKYAIFTLHVVIIALYGKQLFSKEIKAKYHASLKTINDYKERGISYAYYLENRDNWNEDEYLEFNRNVKKAESDNANIVGTLCVLSALTLSIIIANIIVPNFYQFTITQCFVINSSDVAVIGGAEIIFTIIAPFIIAIIALLGALFSITKMECVER